MPGFEPGTSTSRTWRANQAALHPDVPGGVTGHLGSLGQSRPPLNFQVRIELPLKCRSPAVCRVRCSRIHVDR